MTKEKIEQLRSQLYAAKAALNSARLVDCVESIKAACKIVELAWQEIKDE